MTCSPALRLGLSLISALLPLAAQNPTFDPQVLSFTAPPNSTASQTQSVAVSGAAAGQPWRVQTVVSWLKVVVPPTCFTPVNDCALTLTGPLTFTVVATPAELAPGTYTTLVSVSYPSGVTNLPVSFTVGTGPNLLASSPPSVTFSAAPSGASQSQALQIVSNTAGVVFSVTTNAAWLRTDAGTRTLSADAVVNVTASPAGLSVGTYSGQLTLVPILPSGAAGAPLPIPITLLVAIPPRLTSSPTTLSFAQVSGASAAVNAQPLAVGVTSGSPVTYTATPSATRRAHPPIGSPPTSRRRPPAHRSPSRPPAPPLCRPVITPPQSLCRRRALPRWACR